MDPLRAIAAILVMLVHVAIFSGGFAAWPKWALAHFDIGVAFFFLLSGFLLYRPMLASRVSGLPAQRLRDYTRNRFFRIFPLYWTVLVVSAIVPGMYGAFTGNWWVYFGLLMDFPLFTPEGKCATDPFHCAIPPAWTLAIEVFFYILLPFFAMAMAWATRSLKKHEPKRFFTGWVRIELVVLGLLALVSFWIQGQTDRSGFNQWLIFSPLGRAWWFGLGMALAVFSVRTAQLNREIFPVRFARRHAGSCWLAAIAAYLICTYLILEPSPSLAGPATGMGEYLFQYFAFGLIALLVLAPAVFGQIDRGLPNRILGHPALIRLGLISYGIFLWHFPVLMVLNDLELTSKVPGAQFPVLAVGTFLITVLLSAATYLTVEKPLMRWSRQFSKPAGGHGRRDEA